VEVNDDDDDEEEEEDDDSMGGLNIGPIGPMMAIVVVVAVRVISHTTDCVGSGGGVITRTILGTNLLWK
jgi:hypothetical protein